MKEQEAELQLVHQTAVSAAVTLQISPDYITREIISGLQTL